MIRIRQVVADSLAPRNGLAFTTPPNVNQQSYTTHLASRTTDPTHPYTTHVTRPTTVPLPYISQQGYKEKDIRRLSHDMDLLDLSSSDENVEKNFSYTDSSEDVFDKEVRT